MRLASVRLASVRLASSALLSLGVGLAPAAPVHAGGSIALGEALANIDAPDALLREIDTAVRDAGTAADAVICSAARFGRHWTNLGGGRASPYECPIGGRTLHISGRHDYRDAAGAVVAEDAADLPQRAASVRDVDVTWQWK